MRTQWTPRAAARRGDMSCSQARHMPNSQTKEIQCVGVSDTYISMTDYYTLFFVSIFINFFFFLLSYSTVDNFILLLYM
jgi:hypothetical protein